MLVSEGLHVEAEIVYAKLGYRPGEIASASCGLEPGTNAPMVFFGVSDVDKPAPILDRAAAEAAKP